MGSEKDRGNRIPWEFYCPQQLQKAKGWRERGPRWRIWLGKAWTRSAIEWDLKTCLPFETGRKPFEQ